YSFAPPQSRGQCPGFGPGGLFPFTTKRRLPSRLTATDSGYQPVGTRPTTRLLAPSATTDTAFVPPFVTNRVFSSGESARKFGALPLRRPSRTSGAGAATGISSTRAFFAVSITATESVLSHAAYSSVSFAFRRRWLGWPFTGIRALTAGTDVSTTTIS